MLNLSALNLGVGMYSGLGRAVTRMTGFSQVIPLRENAVETKWRYVLNPCSVLNV